MSLIPQVPVSELTNLFEPHGVEVSEHPEGIALKRKEDQATYRFAPTPEGFMRGTQMHFACQRFGLDALAVVFPT